MQATAPPSYGSTHQERKPLIPIVANPRQYLIDAHHHEFIAIVAGGSLLAFNAGFINVISLLISDILVSHTTGNISKASVALANGNAYNFIEISIMLPCFIFGSFITTMLIEDQTFHLTKAYYRVFILGTALLALAAVVGISTQESQLYAYLATIACGMQNAMTTKYSGSILRTTHTTGMATDIGICLGRMLKGKPNELWKLQVQMPLLVAFFLGGVLGCFAHAEYEKHAMFFCVGIFGGIGLLYVGVIAFVRKETYWTALVGKEGKRCVGLDSCGLNGSEVDSPM